MAEQLLVQGATPSGLWSRRDWIWLLMVALNAAYFALLAFSGCAWQPGPFAFVEGCFNHGIDWNSFMAPLGLVVICLLTPLTLVYWLLRVPQLGWRLLRRYWRRRRASAGAAR